MNCSTVYNMTSKDHPKKSTKKEDEETMVLLTIRVPRRFLTDADVLVKASVLPALRLNRSDILRAALALGLDKLRARQGRSR